MGCSNALAKTILLLTVVSIPWLALLLDSQGAEAWPVLYNGPGNDQDLARALAVDAQGNVYVTGTSVGVDSNGDYGTIKYSPSGAVLWAKRYNGPANSYDVATALAVDAEGNVYVTGYSTGNGTDYDYTTIKYSPAGERLWVKRYNGPGNKGDLANAIAVDSGGNIYVTGESGGSTLSFDYFTIKYSPSGGVLWAKRYNGPANGMDEATGLAVDAQGNAYVTGTSVGVGSNGDYATFKYSPAGARLWVRRYNGPANGEDSATALAVDAEGNVYVTGYSTGNGTDYDYTTIKYSPSGAMLWARRYNGPANGEDSATALAVDAEGNVYVTGRSAGTSSFDDYTTIKYSPSGAVLWAKRYNGPGNSEDRARALAVDAQGNVYVTGYSEGIGSGYDYATIKYSPNGERLWVRRYKGSLNGTDLPYTLALDAQGNVYVTGYSYGVDSSDDYATVKYGP